MSLSDLPVFMETSSASISQPGPCLRFLELLSSWIYSDWQVEEDFAERWARGES